jgi:cob(I)alamin adenosyltransferase
MRLANSSVWERVASLVGIMADLKIYTRKGDDGTTGLYYGGRVQKNDPAPAAYGDVDEAQSAIGLARAVARAEQGIDGEVDRMLIALEKDLWVLMADLATDVENRHKLTPGMSQVTEEMVAALEPIIDDLTSRFELPKEFVVPGQTVLSAHLDVARTVVRRAERTSIAAAAEGSLVVAYLNRLSDLLWTVARWQEHGSTLRSREA